MAQKAIRKIDLDEIDKALVRILQHDGRTPLNRLANRLRIPKSTVHYRILRLEKVGIIEGYYARINPSRVGHDYLAVINVRARYGPGYNERVGRKLARVPGVWAVYYVLGDIDFIVIIRATDREDYLTKLEAISSMRDIERTSTQVVAKVLKEDPRFVL